MIRKKVLAIPGSNSIGSINRKLLNHIVTMLDKAKGEVVDINDYSLPLFSVDINNEKGLPKPALDFKALMEESDGFILSFAEYNGSYSSAFKNLLDWLSVIEGKLFEQKPVLLMCATPGEKGGKNVLHAANTYFPYMGADIIGTVSFGKFYDNYKDEFGIVKEELSNEIKEKLSAFENAL